MDAPPRAEILPSRAEIEPQDLSNPFGEPSESERLPSPSLEPVSPSVASVAPVDPPVAPPATEAVPPAPAVLTAPPRGSKQITAILATGLILLSVTTFAQALRGEGAVAPGGSPVGPASSQVSDEDSAAGQRFLSSAQASLLSKDYEMAAAQAQTARERLVASGEAGKEAEARWVLAQALQGRGKLEEAHSICLELYDSAHAEEARKVASALAQELRQQGRALLASGNVDLEKGLLGPALDKARRAESLFRRYGGSTAQIASAGELLNSARKAEAGVGLERPRPQPQRAASRPAPRPDRNQPRVAEASVASGSLEQPSRVPTATRRSPEASSENPEASVDPSNLPLMNQMRRRRAGMPAAEVETAPAQQEAAEEAPSARPQARPVPAYRPSQEEGTRRGRAGSTDVLPSYSNSGGGSVY